MNGLTEATDELLVGMIVNGDAAAVPVLVARYQKPLHVVLQRALGAQEEVDDLAQETWIRVVRSAHRYDPTYPFTSWLFAIAWNLVRNHWANHHESAEIDLSELSTPEASAEERVVEKDRSRQLRGLIRRLPERLGEAILLRYFEELSEKEMAARLGVPVGTVKSRLHHGLRKLAISMKEVETP